MSLVRGLDAFDLRSTNLQTEVSSLDKIIEEFKKIQKDALSRFPHSGQIRGGEEFLESLKTRIPAAYPKGTSLFFKIPWIYTLNLPNLGPLIGTGPIKSLIPPRGEGLAVPLLLIVYIPFNGPTLIKMGLDFAQTAKTVSVGVEFLTIKKSDGKFLFPLSSILQDNPWAEGFFQNKEEKDYAAIGGVLIQRKALLTPAGEIKKDFTRNDLEKLLTSKRPLEKALRMVEIPLSGSRPYSCGFNEADLVARVVQKQLVSPLSTEGER